MADFTREELQKLKEDLRAAGCDAYEAANRHSARGSSRNAHFYDGRRVGLFDAIAAIDELLNSTHGK